jgi:hypothetical protein
MRQALDKADPDGIEYRHENDRNGRRCRFENQGYLRTGANEQIRFQGDELGRQSRYPLGTPLSRSVINDQVLSFDPAVIAQAVLPHFEDWQVQHRAIEIADPARCHLRPQTRRPCEQRHRSRYEVPTLHSILIAA